MIAKVYTPRSSCISSMLFFWNDLKNFWQVSEVDQARPSELKHLSNPERLLQNEKDFFKTALCAKHLCHMLRKTVKISTNIMVKIKRNKTPTAGPPSPNIWAILSNWAADCRLPCMRTAKYWQIWLHTDHDDDDEDGDDYSLSWEMPTDIVHHWQSWCLNVLIKHLLFTKSFLFLLPLSSIVIWIQLFRK